MSASCFTVGEFLATTDPWDYMVKSGLCKPGSAIAHEELLALKESILSMDEVHIAFALGIVENFGPQLFGYEAATLLGHPSLSVRVNAYRVIRAIPRELLTNELRQTVNEGLSGCPQKAQFADALERN